MLHIWPRNTIQFRGNETLEFHRMGCRIQGTVEVKAHALFPLDRWKIAKGLNSERDKLPCFVRPFRHMKTKMKATALDHRLFKHTDRGFRGVGSLSVKRCFCAAIRN